MSQVFHRGPIERVIEVSLGRRVKVGQACQARYPGYHLWRFMVGADHQGRGIGRRAMELLLARRRALGATAARLSVIPGNTDAIRFYESLGFRLTAERDGDELVMRAELTAARD